MYNAENRLIGIPGLNWSVSYTADSLLGFLYAGGSLVDFKGEPSTYLSLSGPELYTVLHGPQALALVPAPGPLEPAQTMPAPNPDPVRSEATPAAPSAPAPLTMPLPPAG